MDTERGSTEPALIVRALLVSAWATLEAETVVPAAVSGLSHSLYVDPARQAISQSYKPVVMDPERGQH